MMKKLLQLLSVSIFSLLLLIWSTSSVSATINVIHPFTNSSLDGGRPEGSPVLSGGKFYGLTPNGGNTDGGMMYSMNSDGSNFTILRSFAWSDPNGGYPYGSPIISGNKLYGMTYGGGNNNKGVVFSTNTDGSEYTVLHAFNSNGSEGANPVGSLILSDGKLYGLTSGGGVNWGGTLFSVDIDGTNFAPLYSFAASPTDGSTPYGSLIISNSKIFGMTNNGGIYGNGTIFSINNDGSNYSVMHSFAGGNDDGAGYEGHGSLLILDNNLYGVTTYGGDNNQGVVFSIDLDGNNYRVLHEFNDSSDQGRIPYSSLVNLENILYGATFTGGLFDHGLIFSINTDGTNYQVLESFDGGGNGENIYSLILENNSLYGVANRGGSADSGTIFSYALPIIYTLTYTVQPNGSITGTSPQTVDSGSSGTAVLAVGNNGYAFLRWSDDSTTNPRQDIGVTGDITVSAEFTNTRTITNPSPSTMQTEVTSGFISIGSSNPTATSNFTFNVNYTFVSGSATVNFPYGTVVTKTGGGTIDLTSFTTTDTTSEIQTELSDALGAVRIGIPNFNLTFSTPITITIPVGEAYNGQTLTTYYKAEGSSEWIAETTCLITSGLCTFQTSHATYFTTRQNTTNNTTTNTVTTNPNQTPVYGDLKPLFIPDLFQINTTKTTAKLFFTPLPDTNQYYISFSTKPTVLEHGELVTLHKEGVQSQTINLLKPNTTYYFKVRGQNGCQPGEWSNIMKVKTNNRNFYKKVLK